MDELLKKINDTIKIRLDDTFALSNIRFHINKIDKDNFRIINKDREKNITNLVFIDGGNQEILSANSFSVGLIRIAIIDYDKNTFFKDVKKYYFFADYDFDEKETINVILFDKKGQKLKEYMMDPKSKEMTLNDHRVSLQKAIEVIRKTLELESAREQLKDNRLVIIDGNLDFDIDIHKKIIEDIYEKSKIAEFLLCAVSKTNDLLTKKGSSANSHIEKISPKSAWYYPVAQKKQMDIHTYLAKLNHDSRYIFRIDILGDKENILFDALSQNSKDPIFLGYPYGLVIADDLARVTNEEKEIEKIRIMTLLGKRNIEILSALNTKNAHQILDNIRF